MGRAVLPVPGVMQTLFRVLSSGALFLPCRRFSLVI